MGVIQLAACLYILAGAVNTGVLVSGEKALLFDCCDTITYERLADLGVKEVDMIVCTQHRRVNVAGVSTFIENGARLIVPAEERALFEQAEEYWKDWKNRWHIYRFQPGPQVLTSSQSADRGVREGDTIEWEGFHIKILDTPGATSGAVSYLVEQENTTFCFSGDVIYGSGKVWDTYSLSSPGYKGILGNRHILKSSLDKLAKSGANVLIPSHGEVIMNPVEATKLTRERIDEAWLLFSAISSLRLRTPSVTDEGADDPRRMPPAQCHELIGFVRRIPPTTYVLRSESGAVFVIDCGNEKIIDELLKMGINSIDGVWVTHYHDDHVGGLGLLYNKYQCPIIADEHVAEVLEHPKRFFLPCINPGSIPVSKITKHGEKWKWREFTLTAYHFPGQTYYHGGLLVEGRGERFFFSGDSFCHYGIDNDTPANRNLLGKGRGHRKCIEVLRETNPSQILHSHFDFTWKFTPKQLDYMDKILAEQEELYRKLLPWEDPNFGTDIWWVRAYPYEQDIFRGSTGTVEVHFTNHAQSSAQVKIEPVLPGGWTWIQTSGNPSTTIGPKEEGAARLVFTVPDNNRPGLHVIPFRITWNGRYLGQIRHAYIYIM